MYILGDINTFKTHRNWLNMWAHLLSLSDWLLSNVCGGFGTIQRFMQNIQIVYNPSLHSFHWFIDVNEPNVSMWKRSGAKTR